MKSIAEPNNIKNIESKWQREWSKAKLFEPEIEPKTGRKKRKSKNKFFATFPFPYMNGPLHLGHTFTATRVDVYARFKRMQGFNVLFPWAWHFTGETIPGVAKRIANGDEKILRAIRDIDGVPDEEIKKFIDPIYLANYYRKDATAGVSSVGFSVDWRRQFATTDSYFKKFIEWQYLTLKAAGYVVKGTHPVVYCPNCQSATGDHDRLEGEGVSVAEFMFLKFGFEDSRHGKLVLPAATLRLETIFGVTNMWMNPDVTYVKVKIGRKVDKVAGETWLVSKDCAEKLEYQQFEIEIVGEVRGSELIGKSCVNPVLQNRILILPASFVNPDVGSGIVMSVPSHAPYDYVALEELRSNPDRLKQFAIDPDALKDILPISLIELGGFGEHPAIDICKRLNIRSQTDKRLDEATEEIYTKEFHQGVLKTNTGKYAGKKVFEVKSQIINDFINAGIAARIYDLPEQVICRCTTKCLVKILENQWFLKFSDKKWKADAKKCIKDMAIYPEEARNWFNDVVDWLEDKACTRKHGLGTQLPWDREWTVETLGDSTIYMAFYTIAHLIEKHKIKPEELTKEVFDFIFLGRKLRSSKRTKVWKEMRESFTYWYPVDFRNSAKELIPNHLTFYIFHHTAIFPEKLWPRCIGVNGMINIEGEKMSKSKGNFITLKQAVADYGADATRFTLMNTSEGLDDADFRKKDAELAKNTLDNFYTVVQKIAKSKTRKSMQMDRWLLSSLQGRIEQAAAAYEQTKFKTALHHCFYGIMSDVKTYMRRNDIVGARGGSMKGGSAGKDARKDNAIGKDVAKILPAVWPRLLAPVAPHVCEELWHELGNKDFVSIAEWPEPEKKFKDKKTEELEQEFQKTVEDIRHVKRLAERKMKIRSAYLYFATGKELEYFKESMEFLKEEFGFGKLQLFQVSDKKIHDPQQKAQKVKYGKPGIYFES